MARGRSESHFNLLGRRDGRMTRSGIRTATAFFFLLMWTACGLAQADAAKVRVVSFNMGTHKQPFPTLEQVARAVQETGGRVDVLLVQETPFAVKHHALAHELGFEHFVSGRDHKPTTNRAIFSRTPLTNPVLIPVISFGPGSGAGALCATTRIQDAEVLLCSVHLETIREEMTPNEHLSTGVILKYVKKELFEENTRSRSVDTLIARISELDAKRVIIGGDFNTFPLSKAIRKMNARFEDAFWPSMAFFKGSYVDFPLFIKPRIDFIFHSPGMSARDCKVHKLTSGDHVPVSAVIMFE